MLVVVPTMSIMGNERVMVVMVLIGPIALIVMIIGQKATGTDSSEKAHEGQSSKF